MVFWLQPLILFDVRPKLEDGAHAKEQTHCSGHFFFLSSSPSRPCRQLSCQSRPGPVIPVTQTDCLCRCYLLLREGTSNMTYARSSAVPKNCNLGRIAAQAWRCSARYAVPRTHARTPLGRCHVWLSGCCHKSVQALSLFVWRPLLLSRRVSLIKTGLRAKSRASAHTHPTRRQPLIFIILSHRQIPPPAPRRRAHADGAEAQR